MESSNLELSNHYDGLYRSAIEQIKNGSYQTDKLIDSVSDKRFGITLLIRPPEQIKNEIERVLQQFKQIEPAQYSYPESDIHITVMSIISCYEGFELSRIEVAEYINIIKKSLIGAAPFSICFKGLTASSSCLMVQGFPENEILNQIRNNLRDCFKNSSLEHSIDSRYPIKTAHSTVFRLKNELNNRDKFIETIDQFKDYSFGSFVVETVELVYNDWYQRKRNVKKLSGFKLK